MQPVYFNMAIQSMSPLRLSLGIRLNGVYKTTTRSLCRGPSNMVIPGTLHRIFFTGVGLLMAEGSKKCNVCMA